MMTEKEMREADVPTFDTLDELTDYIRSLTERDHDYGTSASVIFPESAAK